MTILQLIGRLNSETYKCYHDRIIRDHDSTPTTVSLELRSVGHYIAVNFYAHILIVLILSFSVSMGREILDTLMEP